MANAGWGAALQSLGSSITGYTQEQDRRKREEEDRKKQMEDNEKLFELREKFREQRSPKATRQIKENDASGNLVERTEEFTPPADGQTEGTWSILSNYTTPKKKDFTIQTWPEGDQTTTYQVNNEDGSKTRLATAPRWSPKEKSGDGNGAYPKLMPQTDEHGERRMVMVDAKGLMENGEPYTTRVWRERRGSAAGGSSSTPDATTATGRAKAMPADDVGPAYPAPTDVQMVMPPDRPPPGPQIVMPPSKAPLSQLQPSVTPTPAPAAPLSQLQPNAAPVAPPQAPQAGANAAGATPNNPIIAQPGMPRPPSGTWVKYTNGQVAQVP